MKYVVLFLKLVVFVSVLLVRLDEWDISWVYSGSKYRNAFNYYKDSLANVIIFLIFLAVRGLFMLLTANIGKSMEGVLMYAKKMPLAIPKSQVYCWVAPV